MPHTNKASAPVSVDIPEFEGRYVDLDGYTVGFETYRADVDPAEFFRGLPDDRCQCPHWGVVLTGSISFRFADHTETYAAGDAYYAPAGHAGHDGRHRGRRVQPDRGTQRDHGRRRGQPRSRRWRTGMTATTLMQDEAGACGALAEHAGAVTLIRP